MRRRAGVDGRADAVLFEHDIALNGRGGLILAGLDDPVVAGGARTEDFEDDDRVINDSRVSVDGGAHDHSVGIADVAFRDLKFEIASVELARLSAEAACQGKSQISLDGRVTECAAGHGDGADAVEFVAQGLPFLPFEELGERHRFAQGKVHRRPLFIMNGNG
jgi:hypothetical protein